MEKLNTRLQHPRDQIVEIITRIYRAGLTTTSGDNISILDDEGWLELERLKASLLPFYKGGLTLSELDDMPLSRLMFFRDEAERQSREQRQELEKARRR